MANRAFPANIVIYRDGVSTGQVKAVLDNEVKVLRPAFESAKSKSPMKDQDIPFRYSYVIVNKRINAKFYEYQGEDFFKSRSCQSGTLVDDEITTNKDFYIVAQKVT